MKIINRTQQTCLAERARKAAGVLSRMRGLLGRKELQPGEGLLLTRCKSIHMVFMRFAIDAVFIDADNRVVGIEHSIRPFRLSRYYAKASCAVELPAGTARAARTAVGDVLEFLE